MDIQEHISRTKQLLGIAAEDIHKWIDGYFDKESFRQFMETRSARGNFNPYDHRRHRHCIEALQDALDEFKNTYQEETIEKVFRMHLKDDYQGYVPERTDFSDPGFLSKYHQGSPEIKESEEKQLFGVDQLEEYFAGKAYRTQRERMPGDYGFWLRIMLPTALTVLLFVIFIFIVIVPKIHSVMIDDKRELIQELAKTGVSVIRYYIEQTSAREMDVQSAQMHAISELSKIRYGVQAKDYFWIIDYHPHMVMHPYRPELIGSDLTNYRDHEDKSGKYLFREAVELVAEKGEGFLQYYWQWMDNPDTSALKLSYVVDIPEWKWILGTGVYINDIEVEMNAITRSLIIVSILLLVILLIFMSFIIIQGRSIEHRRRRAEAALKEAKLRYRSLVETANEGYILVVDKAVTYSNTRVQQMLDMGEQELRGKNIQEIIAAQSGTLSMEALHDMCGRKPDMFWLQLQLRSRNGTAFDVNAKVSKVFLSDTVAYLITVRNIQQYQHSIILDASQKVEDSVEHILTDIRASKNPGHCMLSLQRLPAVILSGNCMSAAQKRGAIMNCYYAVTDTLITIIKPELDQKYAAFTGEKNFAFLHMGSNARGEMTFFSDQDNALVYLETEGENNKKELKRYYLELAVKVCAKLKTGGFDYCPGGIQASNPGWCLSLEQWRRKTEFWMDNFGGKSLLEAQVCADMYNESSDLAMSVKADFLACAKNNPSFIQALANSVLQSGISRPLFGVAGSKQTDGESRINIKDLLRIIESTVRLYAVREGIEPCGTIDRLNALRERSVLKDEMYRDIHASFEQLWDLRFARQLESFRNLTKMDDCIPVIGLSDQERQILRQATESVEGLLAKARYDFLGQIF